jgi:hypothetical protein
MSLKHLRQNAMMGHLVGALEKGQDIGHYGRLVFAMVARHFLDENQCVKLLVKNPHFSEEQAKALWHQVCSRGYNPPTREKIAQWQKEQEFAICPTDDPDACNLYKDLRLPDEVYQQIEEYHEQKAMAE